MPRPLSLMLAAMLVAPAALAMLYVAAHVVG